MWSRFSSDILLHLPPCYQPGFTALPWDAPSHSRQCMCIAPRPHPHGVSGDLFLTPLPLLKPKKEFSTDLIRTSVPAPASPNSIVSSFSLRKQLPTSAPDEGGNHLPRLPSRSPNNALSPAKGSSHLQGRVRCADSQRTNPARPKGHGKRQRDGAQKCADGNVAGEGVGEFDLRFVCSASHLWMKQCFTCGGQARGACLQE